MLEEPGLDYRDITPLYLAPADARAAFERGAVDAWAIWDPYYAAASAATQARLLVDGARADGTPLVANHQFFLTTRNFAENRRSVIEKILAGLKAIEAEMMINPHETALRLSPSTGVPAPILEIACARRGYGINAIAPEIVAEQQKIADSIQRLGLIPKHIAITEALPGWQ